MSFADKRVLADEPPERRARFDNTKPWAALVAVMLHVALVSLSLRVHSDLILTSRAKPGGALRVTLVAPTAEPVPQPPKPQVQPHVRKPAPKPKMLATHHASPRQIAAPDLKPAPKDVPVVTPPAPAQPVTRAQSAASSAPQPTVPLPTPGDAGKNAQLTCAIPAPPYPARARRLGHEGTIELAVTIDPGGHVARARVQKSSGYDELDEAAQQAMLSGQCDPMVLSGHAVATTAVQTLSFHLDR